MEHKHFYNFAFFTILVLLLLSPFITGNNFSTTDLNKIEPIQDKTKTLTPDTNFGDIPLYFIQNKGQVNKTARFYAKTPGYTLWITGKGLIFDSIKEGKSLSPRSASPLNKGGQGGSKFSASSENLIERDISRLLFIGATKNPEIISLDPQKLMVNYFKGNDKSKWVGAVPTSAAILYKNIYNKIDLKVYGIGKQIEYDWIVHPGGDPSEIKFEYKNVKGIKINKQGDLDIQTQFGKLIHKKPFAYQKSAGANGDSLKTEIHALFKKTGKNTYGFTVGKYDENKNLTIDPVVLAYSSYMGEARWTGEWQ